MNSWPMQVGCAVGALMVAVGLARGELIRFDAMLVSRSQEFVDGEAVSFDESFEQFELTSVDLPLRVASNLVLPTTDATFKATAQGFADFFEPVVDRFGNPAELALEANIFSIDSSVSYTTTSTIEEVRTLRFGRSELAGRGGDEKQILSDVFLSGVIIVWTQDAQRDLSGLSGVMEFGVEQVRTVIDDQTSETSESVESLMVTRMGLNGGTGGSVDPFIEGLGTFLFGGPDLVRDLLGDAAPADSFDGMGSVSIMLIPSQVLTYSYPVREDEEFKLRATFSVEVTNVPDGTGVSAVFGRDFEGLGEIINQAFSDLDGQSTQRAINLALAKAPTPAPQRVPSLGPVASGSGGSGPACGALGSTGLVLLGLGAFLLPMVQRRRD